MTDTSSIPREDWLSSPDDETYVRAIMCCQSGDPSRCSSIGRCGMDDTCFPGGTIRHERRDLRAVVGELIRIGRDLRRELAEVRKTRPIAIANPPCPHCGRRAHE